MDRERFSCHSSKNKRANLSFFLRILQSKVILRLLTIRILHQDMANGEMALKHK